MSENKPKTSFEVGADIIREHLRTIPENSGVYRMLSADNSVLYIGKAKNLKKRVTSYTQITRLPHRLQRMVALTRSMEIVITHTEADALLLEANLVVKLQPRFNILLKDDKSFPYIGLSLGHDYPALFKHRGKRNDSAQFFGPFASAQAVNETVLLLQKIFRIRNCTDSYFSARQRPCLQFHIKRCTAPCVGKVSAENYRIQINNAMKFLNGKSSELQQKLSEDMHCASEQLDYERAAEIRDQIKILTSIQSRQEINISGIGDADVIALHQAGGKTAIQIFLFRNDRNFGTRSFIPKHAEDASAEEIMSAFMGQFYAQHEVAPIILLSHMPTDSEVIASALTEKSGHGIDLQCPQRGNKHRIMLHALENAKLSLERHIADASTQRKLLQSVAQVFDLPEMPRRIEVYDNSHLQGTHAVAAFIVATPDGFEKKSYRKFNIKMPQRTETGGDDYAMMHEIISRRFKNYNDEDEATKPDLLLIDGGKGQVHAVLKALELLNISGLAVVGISKGEDRNAGREQFYIKGREIFSLPENDATLHYLQRIRDEAHRFVIGAHRHRRTKAISTTRLDDMPGIGAQRKRALLNHFGSAKAVSEAAISDLEKAPSISAALAKKIYEYFR